MPLHWLASNQCHTDWSRQSFLCATAVPSVRAPNWRPQATCGKRPPVDIAWKILATLGLVAANGYFVACEFAAVGARTSRLELAAPSSFLARLGLSIKHKLDLYLSTCQLGITMASLGLGYVTEPAVAAVLDTPLAWLGLQPLPGQHHHYIAVLIALAISTSLHVVVGEVAPKNWAIFFPDKLLPVLALPLVAFTYIFYPAIWLLNSASNGLLRLSGVKLEHSAHGGLPHTADELRALLTQAIKQGTIAKSSEQILTSAFDFGDLKVRQIMTPAHPGRLPHARPAHRRRASHRPEQRLHPPSPLRRRHRPRHRPGSHEGPVQPPPAHSRPPALQR